MKMIYRVGPSILLFHLAMEAKAEEVAPKSTLAERPDKTNVAAVAAPSNAAMLAQNQSSPSAKSGDTVASSSGANDSRGPVSSSGVSQSSSLAAVSSEKMETKTAAAPAKTAGGSTQDKIIQLTTLRVMREKGMLSEAEYEKSIRDLKEANDIGSDDGPTLLLGRWATTFYGTISVTGNYDSAQFSNDSAGSALIPISTSYAGSHSRVTFTIRGTRFGFRVKAPEFKGLRASSLLEFDLLGNQPVIGSSSGQISENQFYSNAGLRVRHAYVRVDTPVVDVLVGQFWHPFGWLPSYVVSASQITPIPGELFNRAVQLRLSKTYKNKDVELEGVLAVLRPPQRNSGVPEGTAALRFAYSGLQAQRTPGPIDASLAPLSIALSGTVRHFRVPGYFDSSTEYNTTGWGLSASTFVPIIPGSKHKRDGNLSFTGEIAYGRGSSNLYDSLSGGVPLIGGASNTSSVAPALPAGTSYTIDVDSGLGTIDRNGAFRLIRWFTCVAGLQYSVPKLDGKVFLTTNYSYNTSPNAGDLTLSTGSPVRDYQHYVDFNAFADPLPGFRVAAGYSYYFDKFTSGGKGENHRVAVSAFYNF